MGDQRTKGPYVSSDDLLGRVIDLVHGQIEADGRGSVTLGADTGLLRSGLIDSVGVVNLILELESGFAIQLDEADLVEPNFATPGSIVALLEHKGAPVPRK